MISVTATSRVGEVADQIVDVPLEPAVPVQREDRARDDGDAERPAHARALPMSSR